MVTIGVIRRAGVFDTLPAFGRPPPGPAGAGLRRKPRKKTPKLFGQCRESQTEIGFFRMKAV